MVTRVLLKLLLLHHFFHKSNFKHHQEMHFFFLHLDFEIRYQTHLGPPLNIGLYNINELLPLSNDK